MSFLKDIYNQGKVPVCLDCDEELKTWDSHSHVIGAFLEMKLTLLHYDTIMLGLLQSVQYS